ncbi:TerC family protein [Henriciella litoralis]|uniref:TerC family protein n=1 Tax=Henriciella litoralis TaxID=568102 RepID=UPI000A0447FC|nr:tellurium resistance protein TerC [Henriciella litoralis]
MPEIFGDLFTTSGFFTLLMLLLLQAVLGFDNLLYISIESKRTGENAPMVRRWGIGLAMVFRVILLIIIVSLFGLLAEPLFAIAIPRVFDGEFTLQALVTLAGGSFIIYTAIKEITHLLTIDEVGAHGKTGKKSVTQAILMIVAMNLVFSFDSILSAMAIANVKETIDGVTETRYQVTIMTIAIIASGIVMMLMADYVAEFLKRNRMYEVLGLFILFLVGVLLVTEGAHLAHMHIFTFPIEAMSKSSFYLVVGVLVITDVISTNYQKRLWAQRERELSSRQAGETPADTH